MEMEQGQQAKAQEQVEVWAEAVAAAEWVVTVLAQDQVVNVCAQAATQRLNIEQGYRATL